MKASQVEVVLCRCPECKEVVNASVKHQITKEIQKKINNLTLKHGCSLETITLDEYRNNVKEWCLC